jgi:excisionase family DNA binding protein
MLLEESSRSPTGNCSRASCGRVRLIDPTRFYRPSEVWRLSRSPRELVYESLRAGELRAIRRGSRWLIPGTAVIDWIEARGHERQEAP